MMDSKWTWPSEETSKGVNYVIGGAKVTIGRVDCEG